MFDLFAPQQYPHVPPLMVLETTGGGRARMGPNVYADGKACVLPPNGMGFSQTYAQETTLFRPADTQKLQAPVLIIAGVKLNIPGMLGNP